MKLKYYMRGVGVGILFTAFMFVAVIIPNLKFENKIKSAADTGAADEVQSQVAELVGNVSGSSQEEKQVAEEAGPTKENTAAEESEAEASQEIEEVEEETEAEAESEPEAGTEAEGEGEAAGNADAEAEGEAEPEAKADTEGEVEGEKAEAVTEAEPEAEETVPVQDNTSETVKTKDTTFSNRHVKAVRNDDTETVELYIYSGCASEEVAEALCKVGLVKDTTEFDNYLMNAGYANNIHTGTYKFEFGTSYSKIGKKITER